jgi:hypothetical protein
MPNAIKYNTSAETLALKKGNFWIGTGDVGKGPTSSTGFYNGITPPSGGYTIYLNKASGGPSIYTVTTEAQMVSLTNTIGSQNFTTSGQCLNWFATQTDKMIFNIDYPAIVTDGLILNIDAGFIPSYPTTNTSWYNLSSGGNNGVLTNGPTFNSAYNGGIVFDGVDDHVKISSIPVAVQGAGTISFFGYYARISGVLNVITIISGGAAIQVGVRSSAGSVWSYGGGNLLNYTIPTINKITQWTVTFNGSNVKVFIDGVLNNLTTTAPNQTGSNSIFYIGTYTDIGLEAFQGTIYNCQVYNRVLSNDEISQNYNTIKERFGL